MLRPPAGMEWRQYCSSDLSAALYNWPLERERAVLLRHAKNATWFPYYIGDIVIIPPPETQSISIYIFPSLSSFRFTAAAGYSTAHTCPTYSPSLCFLSPLIFFLYRRNDALDRNSLPGACYTIWLTCNGLRYCSPASIYLCDVAKGFFSLSLFPDPLYNLIICPSRVYSTSSRLIARRQCLTDGEGEGWAVVVVINNNWIIAAIDSKSLAIFCFVGAL